MKQQTILVIISQPEEFLDPCPDCGQKNDECTHREQFQVSVDESTGMLAVAGRAQKAFRSTFTMPDGREADSDLFSMQSRHAVSAFIDEALAGGAGKI